MGLNLRDIQLPPDAPDEMTVDELRELLQSQQDAAPLMSAKLTKKQRVTLARYRQRALRAQQARLATAFVFGAATLLCCILSYTLYILWRA